MLFPSMSHASQSCNPISKKAVKSISATFQQNPFYLIDSFLALQRKPKVQKSVKAQNLIIGASFDVFKIYKTNMRLFKSKALSPITFDWVRTQYFATHQKDISQKIKSLIKVNKDLLNSNELSSLKKGSLHAKSFKRRNCTSEESKFMGCSSIFEVTIQNSPEVSCKKREMISSFESTFYLTYSKNYGFKILDIAVSGKRIVLDTIKHMVHLKDRGFNKNAIYSQLVTLSQKPKTFRVPKKQVSTSKFLARIRKSNANRVPSSL